MRRDFLLAAAVVIGVSVITVITDPSIMRRVATRVIDTSTADLLYIFGTSGVDDIHAVDGDQSGGNDLIRVYEASTLCSCSKLTCVSKFYRLNLLECN